MNSKEANKSLKEGLKKTVIYVLISIPLSFLLIKVIELKYTNLFWSFMAILGVSSIIAEWFLYEPENKKGRFVKTMEHIAYISFIVLIFQWVYFMWFSK